MSKRKIPPGLSAAEKGKLLLHFLRRATREGRTALFHAARHGGHSLRLLEAAKKEKQEKLTARKAAAVAAIAQGTHVPLRNPGPLRLRRRTP